MCFNCYLLYVFIFSGDIFRFGYFALPNSVSPSCDEEVMSKVRAIGSNGVVRRYVDVLIVH